MTQIDSGLGGFVNIPPVALTKKLLIVLFGESNSGGIAQNSSATLSELSPRNTKILNNTTLQFEALDIGSNNLIGHIGLESYVSTAHGMENEIANKFDTGYFNEYEIFIVKAGAGGSKVSQWQTGGVYYNTFKSRVNTAINLLFPTEPINIKFMLTLGINDKLAGTSTADYKNGLKTLINNIKADYAFRIWIKLMTFEFVTSAASNCYTTQINEVAKETMMNTFTTQSCPVLSDGNHLDYFGMKTATTNFLTENLNIVCDGNSLTQGQGGTPYPTYLSGLVQNAVIQNFGVGGQTTSQMSSDAVTQIDTLIDIKKKNILVAWEIGNDIYFNGNVTTACNNFKSYCDARRAAGWQKIIVINCTPRGQSTSFGDTSIQFNQKLVDANSWLSSNYQTFADNLIDLASDVRFQGYSLSVYNSDLIHFNSNGYSIVADKVKAIL